VSKEFEDMGHTFCSESLAITVGPASEFVDVGLTIFRCCSQKGSGRIFRSLNWGAAAI